MKCEDCKKEMCDNKISSCTKKHLVIDGVEYKRDTTHFDTNKKCHDCNIVNKKGNTHHFGCDMERCPRCKGQLISCGCLE